MNSIWTSGLSSLLVLSGVIGDNQEFSRGAQDNHLLFSNTSVGGVIGEQQEQLSKNSPFTVKCEGRGATVLVQKGELYFEIPFRTKVGDRVETELKRSQPITEKCSGVQGEWKIIPGDKGVTFTRRCSVRQPNRRPIQLRRNESKLVNDPMICPGEPSSPLGDDISSKSQLAGSTDSLALIPAQPHRSIPYLIQPRYTLLQNPRPTFAWKAIEPVGFSLSPAPVNYSVMLYKITRGEKISAWSKFHCKQASGKAIEKFEYPLEPEIQPETLYQLEVKAYCTQDFFGSSYKIPCGLSQDEEILASFNSYRYQPRPQEQFPVVGLSFERVNPVTLSLILQAIQEIKDEKQLTQTQVSQAIAEEYKAKKVTFEAIEAVKHAILMGTDPERASFHKTLSAYYEKLGLIDLAIYHAFQATQLMQKSDLKDEKKKEKIQELRKMVQNFCQQNPRAFKQACGEIEYSRSFSGDSFDRVSFEEGFTTDCQSVSNLTSIQHK